jgi:hypothetical protein
VRVLCVDACTGLPLVLTVSGLDSNSGSQMNPDDYTSGPSGDSDQILQVSDALTEFTTLPAPTNFSSRTVLTCDFGT